MNKKKVIISTVVVGVLAALAGGGFYAGKLHYSTHFYPGTFINGIGVSNQTVASAEARIANAENHYSLTVSLRGDEDIILTAEDLGMEFILDGSVEKLMKAQSEDAFWVSKISGQKDLTIDADYTASADKIAETLTEVDAFQEENMVPPTDAELTYDGSTYSVIEAEEGTVIDVEKAIEAIAEAAENQEESIDLDELGLYEQIENPVDAAVLQAQADAANLMLTANISYQLAGNTYTVNNDVLKDWVSLQEDGNVTLNEEAVKKWVDQMAYETDTFGLAHTFTTHSGVTIQLAGGGDYGWAMNEDATTEELIAMIKEGTQNDNAAPKYQYSAQDRGANDIGNTYVEINLTAQKMWAYVNGEQIVETDIVSGNESAGMSTPSGSVWAIDGKISPRHFVTTNVDVDFWLPFNGGVGLHNASWRSEYGGEIFRTNGSHGCINTPYDAMQTIFNNMEIGYPVVVYYSEEQVVGPTPTTEVTGG